MTKSPEHKSMISDGVTILVGSPRVADTKLRVNDGRFFYHDPPKPDGADASILPGMEAYIRNQLFDGYPTSPMKCTVIITHVGIDGLTEDECVRRFELGMREERIRTGRDGKFVSGESPLTPSQFRVAQRAFTQKVRAKAAEARTIEKERVKVERDTDYWNE